MKFAKAALAGLFAFAGFAQSKLVVYGPQELIDDFQDKSNDSKSKP